MLSDFWLFTGPSIVIAEERVSFLSDDLRLEGWLSYPQDLFRGPGVLLCPPHPHLGGNMENNLINALHRCLAARGCISLRFNYRGVGNSQGSAEDDREDLKTFWDDSWTPGDDLKLQDVFSALDYLRGVRGVMQDNLFLAGYSFGAYLATRAVEKGSGVRGLVAIAPTVHFHDFSYCNRCSLPKYIIGSDNDFSYSLEELEERYADFANPKRLEVVKGVDHFFIGCEEAVAEKVAQFVADNSSEQPACG